MPIIETIELQEPVFTTKYAVLPKIEDYNNLNDLIGDTYQYPRNATAFYADPNPVIIWDQQYYMRIETDVQRNHAECLTGITLVDSIPEEPIIEELITEP